MKLFKPRGYRWIVPMLVLISGYINLTNPIVMKTTRTIWLIFIPILIVLLLIEIINHYQLIKSRIPEK